MLTEYRNEEIYNFYLLETVHVSQEYIFDMNGIYIAHPASSRFLLTWKSQTEMVLCILSRFIAVAVYQNISIPEEACITTWLFTIDRVYHHRLGLFMGESRVSKLMTRPHKKA